ncbi:MAG: hypothetical protein ACI976_003087 [Aureispira sp.]|jgi:hypothetical protein
MNEKFIPANIRDLINSKNATNNFLALTLLRSQLGFAFTKAFAQLKMIPSQEFSFLVTSKYTVLILNYTIIFLIEHKWNEAEKYPYLAIERAVKQGETVLEAYQKSFSILYFESENERDIYEAFVDRPNLGEGLENLFF